MKDNHLKSLNDLSSYPTQEAFLREIQSIRENIWSVFTSNGWSDDDYYDDREENMSNVLPKEEDDIVDSFYDTLNVPSWYCDTENLEKND